MTAENREKGFIKIYRSILQWEWWDDINTFRLFVTILIHANWKEKKWHGRTIPRGSMFTSLSSLSKLSGLTPKQVRRSLSKLIETNEVTSERANNGRLVTVINYDFYQSQDENGANERADKKADLGQTEGKRRATTKEHKEVKELKNNVVVAREEEDLRKRLTPSDIDSLYDRFPSSAGYLIETVAKEVKERKRKVKNPVPYILEYAKRVGWDDGAEHFRDPWFE